MIKNVYIHIPFCVKKCKYCAFCSFPLVNKKDEYIQALLSEIRHFYHHEKLETIYFGGGTPSLLDAKDIAEILSCFDYSDETEITLELNPNDSYKIRDFSLVGVNRISMGVQSFDDNILKIIGRSHSSIDIFRAIETINDCHIKNYSVDLMYGLPNQSIDIWRDTLKQTVDINPCHVSLYGLKIEQGTYFAKNMPSNLPNDDMQAEMYEMALEELVKKYIHYEFSNFAKGEKYFSKHNLAYWDCKKYYGFGLSASGYFDLGRYTNTYNFREYIKNPLEKKYEKLGMTQKIEEEIFLGLRKISGIDFEKINHKFNIDIYKMYQNVFEKFLNYGFLERTKFGVKLTQKGVLLSNEILCEFLG